VAPWFLLAGGIGLAILGCVLAVLSGPYGPLGPKKPIKAPERDTDLIRDHFRELNKSDQLPLPNVLVAVGLVLVLVSLVWRFGARMAP
jgi:hypothetical protein